MKTSVPRYLLSFSLVNLLLITASAQQDPGTQPAATSTQTTPAAPSQASDQSKDSQNNTQNKAASDTTQGTSNDRLFFALPNFLTLENGANVPPLTVGQKFKVVARGSFDYILIPWYGLLAGISQASNSEPGYGQGAEGYGKRYGAAFADGTIENFMVQAIVPSVLHQDPRFFQMGKGTFLHRTEYAMSRIVITRTDSGHHQFNFSEIFGGAASAAISTYSYHPSADRTVSNTAKVWGTQTSYDTLTLVIKEFWPDIRRRISKKKHSPSD